VMYSIKILNLKPLKMLKKFAFYKCLLLMIIV
jgi:hypothetical protein